MLSFGGQSPRPVLDAVRLNLWKDDSADYLCLAVKIGDDEQRMIRLELHEARRFGREVQKMAGPSSE